MGYKDVVNDLKEICMDDKNKLSILNHILIYPTAIIIYLMLKFVSKKENNYDK